jgi:hypothetical protein
MSDKAEAFKTLLKKCWFSQIRDLDVGSDMQKIIRSPYGPLTEAEFKWHLADAILSKRFSIEEYERLTDFDFETREEVAEDLAQLWRLVCGDEPIALPAEPSGR